MLAGVLSGGCWIVTNPRSSQKISFHRLLLLWSSVSSAFLILMEWLGGRGEANFLQISLPCREQPSAEELLDSQSSFWVCSGSRGAQRLRWKWEPSFEACTGRVQSNSGYGRVSRRRAELGKLSHCPFPVLYPCLSCLDPNEKGAVEAVSMASHRKPCIRQMGILVLSLTVLSPGILVLCFRSPAMYLNSVTFICREIVSPSSTFLAVELFRSTSGVSSGQSLCTVNVGWRREGSIHQPDWERGGKSWWDSPEG